MIGHMALWSGISTFIKHQNPSGDMLMTNSSIKSGVKSAAKISLILTGIAIAGGSLASCAKGEGDNPPNTVFETPKSAPRGSH